MEDTYLNIWIILATLLFAGARIAGYKSEAFQAIAHIYIGGLFSAYIVFYVCRYKAVDILISAITLSLIELGCFLLGV